MVYKPRFKERGFVSVNILMLESAMEKFKIDEIPENFNEYIMLELKATLSVFSLVEVVALVTLAITMISTAASDSTLVDIGVYASTLIPVIIFRGYNYLDYKRKAHESDEYSQEILKESYHKKNSALLTTVLIFHILSLVLNADYSNAGGTTLIFGAIMVEFCVLLAIHEKTNDRYRSLSNRKYELEIEQIAADLGLTVEQYWERNLSAFSGFKGFSGFSDFSDFSGSKRSRRSKRPTKSTEFDSVEDSSRLDATEQEDLLEASNLRLSQLLMDDGHNEIGELDKSLKES
jgi:hypothetical protein